MQLEEVLYQQGGVCLPFVQRRKDDGEHFQPIIGIIAKSAFSSSSADASKPDNLYSHWIVSSSSSLSLSRTTTESSRN